MSEVSGELILPCEICCQRMRRIMQGVRCSAESVVPDQAVVACKLSAVENRYACASCQSGRQSVCFEAPILR